MIDDNQIWWNKYNPVERSLWIMAAVWRLCYVTSSAEFDALLRLGIPDPCNYIKKRFKSNKLLFLTAACMGQALVDQVEASVEEAVNSATWTDIQVPLG